jgi:hypothetical protein
MATLGMSDPPQLKLFKKLLSKAPPDKWAIDSIILEKLQEEPGLYTGSGTNVDGSINSRHVRYNNIALDDSAMPSLSKGAYAEGYRLASKGVICTIPRVQKNTALMPMRAVIKVLEAMSFWYFWTMNWNHRADSMGNVGPRTP